MGKVAAFTKKSPSNPLFEVVEMTPKMAEKILQEKNTDNRRIKASHVRSIAAAMERGEWQRTHQGIAFTKSGRLIDGQHRLKAIVQSGVTVQILVFYDVEESTYTVLDNGSRRSFSDALGISIQLASVLSKIYDMSNPREKATSDLISSIGEIFGDTAGELFDMKSPTRGNISNASIRSTAILRAMQFPEEKEYIFAMYDNLCRLNHSDLSKSGAALMRICSKPALHSCNARIKLVAQSWLGFNPERKDMSRIQVTCAKRTGLEIQDFIMEKIRNA